MNYHSPDITYLHIRKKTTNRSIGMPDLTNDSNKFYRQRHQWQSFHSPLSMTNRQLILIIFHILQRLQSFIFHPSGQKILVWSIVWSVVKVFSLKRYFHTSVFSFGWSNRVEKSLSPTKWENKTSSINVFLGPITILIVVL